MIPKSGNRFPACAKPWQMLYVRVEASAGVGRSVKIMRKKNIALAICFHGNSV
jgi:hypothetical protein